MPSSRRTRNRVPPSLAARYDDIRFVSEGGMGIVYRALDPRLGRPVALKISKGDDPELWRRFVAEARAQARLDHDHVCRVYDAGEADGESYIAMQYIDGQPLSLVGPRLTLEQRVKVMQQIAAAVHEAHRLGMIHRDIKPANILVERSEAGTLKPYILDFGLVRELGEHGLTQSGIVVGTPAYMSPEQTHGHASTLDRRSDVYSLGATLYDVIAGHAPFVAEHPWKLLMLVAEGDVPPLGKIKKGVPPGLETIVMKCLEREPLRRYESARALAEDLQRFLDGEAIQAQPPTVRHLLWHKARKNKLVTALLALLVAASVGLTGVGWGAQRKAAEQAQLARELGEGVKEMELFLRTAYALPLHDVERERDLVRAKLADIEQRMAAAGAAGAGPGHYALGRGQLALGDPAQARAHLERAFAAGYASPELRYALGRALGELFQRALQETRRITNEAERKRKVAELEKALRDPALVHLRAAVGAKIEVPAHAEGLIALCEGRNEEAVAKAKEAFEKAPWLYDAKKLEGDALFAEGSKHRHDAAFDPDKMKGYFEPAAAAYRIAAEIGRSDPEVHRAECDLWEKLGQAALSQVLPAAVPFGMAEAACARAVQASSKDGRVLVQRALVLAARVYALGSDASEATLAAAEKALLAAHDGARACPGDVTANYAVALALYLQTRALYGLGREASMAGAIAAYERVLEMDPRFTWAVNELGEAHLFEAKKAIASGRDGSRFAASAIRQYEQAMALDPHFALPAGGRLEVLSVQLQSELERGQSPEATLQALSSAVAQLEATASSPWIVAFWKARAQRLRGAANFASGRDPMPAIAAAMAGIRAFAGESPTDYWLLEELARCSLLEVEHALRVGLDPEPALVQAYDAVQKARGTGDSMSPPLRLLAARIAMATVRVAGRRGKVTMASFEQALADVRPLLASPGFDAEAAQVSAEIHALRAGWLAKSGHSPAADERSGLAMADRALAKNPHLARAFIAKARIHLAIARTSRGEPERTLAAARAKEAFAAAVRENPFLAREPVPGAKEVDGLLQ